jgi:hypothetical protein
MGEKVYVFWGYVPFYVAFIMPRDKRKGKIRYSFIFKLFPLYLLDCLLYETFEKKL